MTSFFVGRLNLFLMGALLSAFLLRAEDQVWDDLGPDNIWSTNAPNWSGGAVWANGNSAVFSGAGGTLTGEVVDVAAVVTVSDITFQTNGYTIADSDNDGSLSLAGGTSVITVMNAGDSAVVSEVIAGTGFTKAGSGLLQIKGANTYTGVTTVSAGILRLNANTAAALGATGTGNHTVVEDGATLDIFSAYSGNRDEDITIKGKGVGGIGAFVNLGPTPYYNVGYRNLTLAGDATIGGSQRFDMSGNGTYYGNGYTLTKAGSCEVAISRAVTNSPIVISAGSYTMQIGSALGGSDFPTTVNGGTLNGWPSLTMTERIFFNGGAIRQSSASNTFTLAGHMTLSNRIDVQSGTTSSVVNLTGYLDGPGGLRRAGGGFCILMGSTNSYTGATVIDSGSTFFVGRTNGLAGWFGSGDVTNNGTLYLDRGGTIVCSNGFFGGGTTAYRYGLDLTVSDSFSSNATWHLGHGSIMLTNGAAFCVYNELTIANRDNVWYGCQDWYNSLAVKLTNVVATFTVNDGCLLQVKSMTFGNGGDLTGGMMTGILNQVGGVVRTTGAAAEGNGVRLGHYPQTRSFYNMMGGQLFVENDWDLSCATDGNGWFNMTGGEVFSKRVMLNERDYDGGFGRLTVAGGTLNVGSLTGSTVALSNGIVADAYARYLVELGGAGGVIRAVTNLWMPVSATLFGSNENAITFDTQEWAVTLTNTLSGAGGLNKTGTGTLELSGNNTYTGATRVLQGRLVPASAHALPAGGLVLFGVTADDAGGVLHATGDFSLSGLNVGVANPEVLDKARHYTVITCDGELSGLVASCSLPEPWYLYYDWQNDKVELRAAIGTVILMK